MRRLLLTLILLSSACTGSSSATSTTSTALLAEVTTTSTSTTQAPTTTEAATVRRIVGLTQFEPGVAYRGELLGAPVEFELGYRLDGWRVDVVGVSLGRFIYIDNRSPDLPVEVAGSITAWMEDQSITEVADWWRSRDQVEQSTEAISTSVNGAEAVQFDLLLAPTDDAEPTTACFGLILFTEQTISRSEDVWQHGPLGCTWTRFWIVDVDGLAITVFAQLAWSGRDKLDAENPWQIEDLQPGLDDFIDGLTFCTTTAPCDG